MFLLVNNFKMIGMLLNVVHGQVQTYNKGFPNHYTSINCSAINEAPVFVFRINSGCCSATLSTDS